MAQANATPQTKTRATARVASFWVPVLFGMLGASTAYALDSAPKQIQIESKIVEVSKAASKELTLYLPAENRDAKAEFAFVLTPLPENKTKIEVSSLVFGGGADFRRWVPQNPQLLINNAALKLLPVDTGKIYVTKPSAAVPAATFLFAAIGSQYEAAGEKAAGTPGQVCPVTGKPLSEGSGSGRSDTARALDKTGMAVGMGLLTSQAKGQLDGLKSVFISDLPVLNLQLKTEAVNADKKKLIIFMTPTIQTGVGE
jgi:hypothetical protein